MLAKYSIRAKITAVVAFLAHSDDGQWERLNVRQMLRYQRLHR